MKQTLYQILGLEPGASTQEITSAYERHLQALGENADLSQTAILRQARDVLSDTQQRAAYDASLTGGAAPGEPQSRETAPSFVHTWGRWIAAAVVLVVLALWWGRQPPELPPDVVESPAPGPDADISDTPLDASPDADPATAASVAAPDAPAPAEPAQAHPIVGDWSCFDPVSGRTSHYGFQADGSLAIDMTGSPSRELKYTAGPDAVTVIDAEKTSRLRIEELSGRKLVLNTGGEGQRLVCNR